MRVSFALPGGCESEGQSAGGSGSSADPQSVQPQVEESAARHAHEWNQEHPSDVSNKYVELKWTQSDV